MDAHAQFFPDEIKERELPPCDLEHLDELLLLLKTSHPTVRSRLLRDLACDDGAYIVKLLDLFDVSEIDAEPPVLHRIFDICYALLELCDRRVLEILLSDQNFLSVVGVFGHNPGLLRAMDFRTELEGKSGFNEVIPFLDASVRQRVHQNFRIHVIKDNVLSRSLPDCTVIMLDHIVNENNYHILSYISDSDAYWQAIKTLVKDPDQQRRRDGLGLLKEVIQLVRTTRPLDKLPQQLRRDGFGAPPVFGQLLNQLFGDGAIFEAFSEILGSPQSSKLEIERALDILNTLVLYQGPERLRTYLASEGKCIAPPTSDKERIQWKHGASLFTALLVVFETYEATRVQLVTLLKEICKVSLPQDDKFLNVMYPNYMHWLLQPLKYLSVDEEGASLFALQDSIMELLTFCTEAHGYRIKYLFGRQPIASYVDRMLRSRNKLFVIHAVKFMRACAARGEAFFSRFLIQNDLFTPMMEKLKSGQRNTCAVSSAILELLAYIEKSNLSSLVEHIYRKFYDTYKDECPIVFQALRVRFEDTFGASSMSQHADGHERDNVLFVQHNASMMDDEDARYWETDDPPESFAPAFVKDEVPATGQVRCRVPKLTDNGEDDDDEPASPLKEGDLMIPSRDEASPAQVADDSKDETMSSGDESKMEDEEEEDFQLPVREKKTEEDFLAAAGVNGLKLHTKKKTPSPQVKSMFQQISWKVASPNSNGTSTSSPPSNEGSPDSTDATATAVANGHGHAADENDSSSSPAKRKLDIAAAPPSSPEESILKKAKPCTPVSSS